MKQLKKQTNSLAADKEMLHTKMLELSHQLEIARKEAMKSRDSIQQLDEARAQRAKVISSSHKANDRRRQHVDNSKTEWRKYRRDGDRNLHAFSLTFITICVFCCISFSGAGRNMFGVVDWGLDTNYRGKTL